MEEKVSVFWPHFSRSKIMRQPKNNKLEEAQKKWVMRKMQCSLPRSGIDWGIFYDTNPHGSY